jgi:hypothetical protein
MKPHLFGRPIIDPGLANQKHDNRNRQQGHRGNQNVVTPSGKQSKHAQSPSKQITNTATFERPWFRCSYMGSIRCNSTSAEEVFYREKRAFLRQAINSQRLVKTSHVLGYC